MDTQAYNEGYQELLRRSLPSEGVMVNKSLAVMWQLLGQSTRLQNTEKEEAMSFPRIIGASRTGS